MSNQLMCYLSENLQSTAIIIMKGAESMFVRFDLCNTKTDVLNAFKFFYKLLESVYSYLVEVLGWDYTGIRHYDNGFS